MVTLKTDDRGRVKLPGIEPGSVFSFSTEPDGSIRLAQVVEKEAPVVNPVKRKDGSYSWPVKLSREQITAAIRADRDSR